MSTNSKDRNESVVYANNKSSNIHVYGGTYNDSMAFNANNSNCDDGPVITIHEGVQFKDYKNHFTDDYNGGRIVVADGCVLNTVAEGEYSVTRG